MNMGIKALIFDFDGTLGDTEKLQYSSFKKVVENHGGTFVSFDEFVHKYTGTGSEFILRTEFEKNGIGADVEEAVEEKRKIYLKMCHENGVELMPGVQEFLIKTKEQGYKIAIASGSSKDDVEEVRNIAGLADVFDVIVGAGEYKSPKPAPEVFLKTAEKLNIEPKDCIVFEDAINGAEAAKAANMSCYIISTYLPAEVYYRVNSEVKFFKNFAEIKL